MRRIYYVTAIASFFIIALCPLAFAADETITITTYYPSPSGSYNELRTSKMAVGSTRTMSATDGVLVWGNNGQALLTPDQGGSIELGGLNNGNPGTPFIDFHRDNTPFPGNDYDMRLMLNGADELDVTGGQTVFSNEDGTPTVIKVGDVYFCSSYGVNPN